MGLQNRIVNRSCLRNPFRGDSLKYPLGSQSKPIFLFLRVFAGIFVAHHTIYLIEPSLLRLE